MSSLVIFGASEMAELAFFYFSKYTDFSVECFCVDPDFLVDCNFCKKPVIALEEIEEKYPPSSFDCFVAMSYSGLNLNRKNKFLEVRSKGYHMPSFVSPDAYVLSEHKIGQNCMILENNVIQPFARIGNNVTLWSGNHVGHHSIINDHAFISSHVVISGGVEIGEQCFIGVNSTIRDHIHVGRRCIIGAGSLLLEDAAPDGVYLGIKSQRSKVPSTRLRTI